MEDLGIDNKFAVPRVAKPLSDVIGSYTYFSEGDVLLAKITPCFENGKLGIAACLKNGIGFGSSEYFVFRPGADLDKEWLYYFLSSEDFRVEGAQSMSGAVGHKRVSPDFIARSEIPLPPVPAQRRIVRILDEAFDSIATAKANAEKNLENARALFRSELNRVFGQGSEMWPTRRLDEVGTTQTGSTPNTGVRENFGHFIPFIKPADFRGDGSLDYGRDGLSQVGLSQARRIRAGSALMVCIGATIGKCGVCTRDIAANQQINSITPFDGVAPKFLYYQMLGDDFQRRVVLNAGQTTLPIISKSKWGSLSVRLPKPEEQQGVAAHLDAIAADTLSLESLYNQMLAALGALKKSLLHQAFSGGL